jgi:hypothetical protein
MLPFFVFLMVVIFVSFGIFFFVNLFSYLVKYDKEQLTFHEYMLGKNNVKQRKNN